MATLLRIVPKVGEPPDPGSASHFAFDGVERVVKSWQALQTSPSLEGLSSVDDSLLPKTLEDPLVDVDIVRALSN